MDERRVLIVEDNPADERLTRMALSDGRRARYVVESAADLHEAVSLLHSEDPFDVVLLDLNLPDAAGLATVDELQAASKDVPIVVLTGLEDHENRRGRHSARCSGLPGERRTHVGHARPGDRLRQSSVMHCAWRPTTGLWRCVAPDRSCTAWSMGAPDMMAALDTEGPLPGRQHVLLPGDATPLRRGSRGRSQLRELLAPWPVEQELALDLWQRAIAGEEYTVSGDLR